MGKWSTFLISLIPAGLAGYLCYLLVTIGLSVPDDKMGMMFWGPLGAGFLGCVMAFLTPFGIAIFVRSPTQTTTDKSDGDLDVSDDEYEDELDSNEFSDDELVDSEFSSDDELESSDFEVDDFEDDSDAEFQTAEFDSSGFDDDGFSDEFSGEFDSFEDDDDELV